MKESYLVENDLKIIKPCITFVILNSMVKYLYIVLLIFPLSFIGAFFHLDTSLINGLVFTFYIVIAMYNFMLLRSIIYYLTPERLIVEKGIFGKNTNYLEFYNIVQYVKKQSFLMRLFGIFNLFLYSEENEVIFSLQGLNKQRDNLPSILRELVQRAKMKYRFTYYK